MTLTTLTRADGAFELPLFQRQDPGTDRAAQTVEQPVSEPVELPALRLAVCVLLPFAAGYFVSYAFRSINAVIAGTLAAEFDLSPAALGLMTSMYFLVFMLVQLPAGAAIDRYGPRRIQALLIVITAIGAVLFAAAGGLWQLMLGRALIGLGGSIALMTGLKAIILWVPPRRVALANGWLVMLGGLGAVAATLPAELVIATIGWRQLFAVLAIACLAIAAFIYMIVPERPVEAKFDHHTLKVSDVYGDPRFWRIAPLSAAVIASSWSLQGLWAAPWLTEVDQLTRPAVVEVLFAMAVALSAGALALGLAADRLRRRGVAPPSLLAGLASLSVVAQVAIALRLPVPVALPWIIVAIAGASTVLSFASLAALYPKACSGRANAALNLLHVGGAFFIQAGFGMIVELWPEQNGQHPAAAHQTALGVLIALQALGIVWFLISSLASGPAVLAAHAMHSVSAGVVDTADPMTIHDRAAGIWCERVANAREQERSWRMAAIGSAAVALSIAALLAATIKQRDAPPRHIIERHAGTSSSEVRGMSTVLITSTSFARHVISSGASARQRRA
jgi:MFS family permease